MNPTPNKPDELLDKILSNLQADTIKASIVGYLSVRTPDDPIHSETKAQIQAHYIRRDEVLGMLKEIDISQDHLLAVCLPHFYQRSEVEQVDICKRTAQMFERRAERYNQIKSALQGDIREEDV